ncbi:MAG: LysM peptidoglycan-binding domain-containing protein, partial [Chlorobi bacterium]|nr:LysM peptidoglycan-binding domain-containing protein [Chlorobiota bacterium]
KGLFILHKVKRKETLFSISQKYNVDMDILRKVNQLLDLNHLKKGMVLKIPTDDWYKQVYFHEQETEEDNKQKITNRTEQDSIAYADCISYQYYTERPTLKIGLMLPFDVYDSKQINIIRETDDNGDVKVTERTNKIISNKSKVFVEFYEGMLLAVDQLKKEGTNIELFVYDTQSDSTDKIMDILSRPEVMHLDMIIGPAFAKNLKPVADFAKIHQIKMIYPFSKINPELPSNPEIFQVSPIDTLLFGAMQKEMLKNINGKRVIVIRTKDESNYEKKLSEEIKVNIYKNSFTDGETPDYVEYVYENGEINGLEELFDRNKENIIIIPSNNEAHVSGIVTTIAGIVRNKHINATLWGFPDWMKFQSLKPEDVHQLNGHIFSYYRLDYDDPKTIAFIKKFRKWYHTEPMPVSSYFQKSSVLSNFSRYGIWGYDVSYYFINALKTYGKNFEYCLDEYQPVLIQSDFKFKRISNWGGMYNTGLFILHFTPDYKMIVTKLD